MIQYITGHTYQIIDFPSCWAAAVPFAQQKCFLSLEGGRRMDVSPKQEAAEGCLLHWAYWWGPVH